MNIVSKLPLPGQDQDTTFSFWVDGNHGTKHDVAAFAVEEAVFSLTRVEILLFSAHGALDMQAILGRNATLMVQNCRDALPRCFSGLVVEAASSFDDTAHVITRVLLLPALYRLENGTHCRMFQELSAPDIAQTIFCEHDIGEVVWQLTRHYAPRRFCMQYNESDLAFVQRILAEEGIFYYFASKHDGSQQLVLCDTMQALFDCPGQARLEYGLHDAGRGKDICCSSLLRCYHMAQGGTNAARRADLYGEANSPHLVCGHAVTLDGHPDAALNGKWYLTSVRHEGFHLSHSCAGYGAGSFYLLNPQSRLDMLRASFSPATLKSPGLLEKLVQHSAYASHDTGEAGRAEMHDETGYVCMFSALESRHNFIPPHAAKPVVAGPQKAVVVAAEAAGTAGPRCKVVFAMADNSRPEAGEGGCWVHLASAMGTALPASLPAEGDSVIVDFLGGNPDEPLIIARGAGKDMAAASVPLPQSGRASMDMNAAGHFIVADFPKHAVYQKTAPMGKAADQKPVISLAEMQAALSDGNRNFKTENQKQEWVGASRLVDVGHHQRENIKGIYELNCGEKYLCKTTRLNVDASQKVTIRGPGGRVIIDKSSITFEAPTIRLKGRVIVEDEAYDRLEGIRSAISDELPLAAECSLRGQADTGKS